MEYREKLRQADREAKASVVALVATIVAWAVLGFGVAGTGIVVFSTPLWVFTGVFGTVLFGIAVAVFMARVVFKDVHLDEVEPLEEQPASADSGHRAESEVH